MLTAGASGRLRGGQRAVTAVSVPLNSPRLQGQVGHDGITELFVWGSGAVGKLVFEPPLDWATTVDIRPNSVRYAAAGGSVTISALPDLAAVIVEYDGPPGALRLAPTRVRQPGLPGGFALSAVPDGWLAQSPWATAVLRVSNGVVGRGGRVSVTGRGRRVAVLALGATREEAETTATAVLERPEEAARAAVAYAARLENTLQTDDALLRCMFTACLHAAVSSRKELPGGKFAGLSAGTGYVMPPRTYFRDSYWTLQALLPLQPQVALEQLRLLAGAVADDGEAPSGVIVATEAGERLWEARLADDPRLAVDHPRLGQWWSDHFDSPFYFALLARDALTWTVAAETVGGTGRTARDRLSDMVEESVDGVSLADKIEAVLRRGQRLAGAGVLPIKPYNDRDWADNVFRHGLVTYDVALYHGALLAGAELLAATRPTAAAEYLATAADVRRAATDQLYDPARGHFVEFVPLAEGPGGAAAGEAHLTLDSLVSIRTGLASRTQARESLAATARLLETRNNREQPYGDWGVMSTYPPYLATTRRRAKSRFAYRYHNGSDWPYLDGIYAEALLSAGDPGWRYPLTRWFEYGLEQGWPTPVEYYAPPWGRGSPLNGWSAMPAAAMLLGGMGLSPRGEARVPPWGNCEISGVLTADPSRQGLTPSRVTVEDGRVETTPQSEQHG